MVYTTELCEGTATHVEGGGNFPIMCNKSFMHQNVVKTHQHIHREEQTFSTHICGKSFSMLSKMKSHQCINTTQCPCPRIYVMNLSLSADVLMMICVRDCCEAAIMLNYETQVVVIVSNCTQIHAHF